MAGELDHGKDREGQIDDHLYMETTIALAQAAVALILISLILLQQRGSALGSAFGQEGGAYAERRGVQKHLYYATIVFGALFILIAVVNLISPRLG